MEQGGGGGEVVEEASPISSRPPANMEELLRFSGDDGGGEGGRRSSSGKRWPREETLALLRIRSDTDAAFRDASLKAPLWEDVSRKLGELGYERSGKKCKEKFENLQKYYKRTKEGRGGRNEGKTYKFFSQLEALYTPSASSSVPPSAPLSAAIPPPPQQPPPPPAAPAPGVTLSSHSSSTASSSMGYDDDPGTSTSRKRKRIAKEHGGSRKMMEFFEALMWQVLQKQSSMQRSFLEALEKREQDRLYREEAWKRQEMSRLARDNELMAQERAASASRDAAIVSLIQKITGHTLHLPPSVTVSAAPPPPGPPQQPATAARPAPLQQQQTHQHSQVTETVKLHHQTSQLQPIMAIPEQQIPPPPPPPQQLEMGESGSSEPASSRWPKAEVVVLINLRSGMESKYQEAGPKGLLWEEISSGMRRMGYNRNPKRCKEKWENINKYYKKIKESNKKRPEDAKTCPYFHQLEALYRDKILGSCSGTSTQHPKNSSEARPSPCSSEQVEESSSPGGAGEKPEDIVRELTQRQLTHDEQQRVVMKEEEGKMGYEMEFQLRERGAEGNGRAPSFLTMVQ